MISIEDIKNYNGLILSGNYSHINVKPHKLLCPYISNYTITFPSNAMSNEYTILPSASSTIVIAVNSDWVFSSLRCTNTVATNVGKYANKMTMLLLIEFIPGTMNHFIKADQSELADRSFSLNDINKELSVSMERALLSSTNIGTLIASIDSILIKQLTQSYNTIVSVMTNQIIKSHGNVNIQQLSAQYHYSVKHIRRLFKQHLGTTPKTFSRIVRTSHSAYMLTNRSVRLIDVAYKLGFCDQSHFINDFKAISGVTPSEYKRNMSHFYNDIYKMKIII